MDSVEIGTSLNTDQKVEELSLARMRDRGWNGLWGENYFWWQIMTVLFWDEIFAQIDGVQIARDMPTDFFQPTFYSQRESLIEQRIEELRDSDLTQEFQKLYNKHYGTPARPVEDWDMFEFDQFKGFLSNVDSDLLLEVVHTLLRDFNNHRQGLADLILWKDNDTAYAEVKGPNDSLREAQKRWLSWLEELGANTFIIHVEEAETEKIEIEEDTFDKELGDFESPARFPEKINSDIEPPEYSHDLQAQFESTDDQDKQQAEKDWDRVEEIMTKVVREQGQANTTENELLVLLFPYELHWDEFDAWYEYFTEIDHFPHMWDGLKTKPDQLSQQSQEVLRELSFVSPEARRIFYRLTYFSGGRTSAKQASEVKESLEMDQSTFQQAVDELKGRLIKADLTMQDRLPFLRVKDLKPILEEYDLKKSGLKAELVDRLAENVPDDELREYLPEEAQGELLVNSKCFAEDDDETLRFKKKKIELYLHTAQMTGYLQRDINRFESGSRVRVQAADKVPICQDREGTYELNEQNVEKLPPHFPGCRCSRGLDRSASSAPNQHVKSKSTAQSKTSDRNIATVLLAILGGVFMVLSKIFKALNKQSKK